MRSGGTGTLEYMPPEVLQRDPFGNYLPNHSITIDLWSLGVVLYFICFAEVPFAQTDDVDALREEILQFDSSKMAFPVAKRVPDYFLFLIRSLLSNNIEDRPSADQILKELSSSMNDLSTSNEIEEEKSPEFLVSNSKISSPIIKKSLKEKYQMGLSILSFFIPCIPSLLYSTPKPFLTLGLCLCSIYIFQFKPPYSQLLLPATIMFLLFSM